ncbi:hypothetical protein NA57DRAFT_78617 [Rhizodiscina lignyota]|uniref:Uncharacterized protein n=1 Tax=Rhizodiscina lignyota TaxID=1504668 RepID=A0A9P4I6E2_9PEZI|nr:hypothetical protein NA57DRAFT_78617 [Rhizodiscina lignyota]
MAFQPPAGPVGQQGQAQRAPSEPSPEHSTQRPSSSHRLALSGRLLPNLFARNTSTTSATIETATRGRNERPAAPTLRQLQMNLPHRSRNRSVDVQSTASRSSVSTQPVIVRTYSGSRDRDASHKASRRLSKTREQTTSQAPIHTAMPSPPPPSDPKSTKLPSVEEFKFSLVLQAVEPDIHSAIDAIAEICARSRLSLADEYGAHLPPFTHSLPPMPRTRAMRGEGRSLAHGSGLTTVPETSSSSEHSSPSTTSGSGRTKISAYGSLTKVLTRDGKGSDSKSKQPMSKEAQEQGPSGSKREDAAQSSSIVMHGKGFAKPLLIRIASPKLSNEIASGPTMLLSTSLPADTEQENDQSTTKAHSKSRSWFPWISSSGEPNAEGKLKDLLRAANTKSSGPSVAPG